MSLMKVEYLFKLETIYAQINLVAPLENLPNLLRTSEFNPLQPVSILFRGKSKQVGSIMAKLFTCHVPSNPKAGYHQAKVLHLCT